MESVQPILCKFNAFLKKASIPTFTNPKTYEKCFCNRGLPRHNDGM